MSESTEGDPREESGAERRHDAADDPQQGGGEGARNADATPAISEEGEHGQTEHPAPEEDEGVTHDGE